MTRLCFFAAILICASRAIAADHFLTIGGGFSPQGNQVSLEKNVLMFRDIVKESYPDGAPHDVFFSDGNHPGRDLQFMDPAYKIPRARQLLARVFRTEKYLNLQYRSHGIDGLRGGTSKTNLDRWFKSKGKKLQEGDRLFVYITAHGGKSTDRKQPKNTGLYMWNNQKMVMRDFANMLDQVPDGVSVITVMVQCYSGGFADIMFEGGDQAKGLSGANRCGFFATVHNRVAAGCTPDINEANYQEYSTYFWAAIRGKDRAGKVIDSCDYDGDGRTSFAEAHAYALLESNTIDVSIKTSEEFLRAYSRMTPVKKTAQKATVKKTTLAPPPPAPEAAKCPADANQDLTFANSKEKKSAAATLEDQSAPVPPSAKAVAVDAAHLLTADSPYQDLLERGSPVDRAVLEGLSTQLLLSKPERAKEAKARATAIAKEMRGLDTQRRTKSAEYTRVTQLVSARVTFHWPELANRWHSRVEEILARDSAAVVKAIETHPRYKKLNSLRGELQQLSAKRLNLDRKWAKCQRLIRALENIALAANLPAVGGAEKVAQYERLVKAEAGSFGEAGK